MNVVFVVASALLVVALLLVAWFVVTYNSLIRGRNATDNAWAQQTISCTQKSIRLSPDALAAIRPVRTPRYRPLEM